MAPIISPGQRSASDVVEQLRSKLTGYFEVVEDAVEMASNRPRRAYRLISYVVSRRNALAHAASLLSQSPDRLTPVMREAEMRSIRYPEQLAEIEGRADLLRAWTALLLDSIELVERENRWGDVYASLDPGDDYFVEASAAEARRRWQSET